MKKINKHILHAIEQTTLSPAKQCEVHPARQYLLYLSSQPAKGAVQEFLQELQTPKIYSETIFAEGIKKFTTLANLSYSQRSYLLGDRFAGLHYSNDLAREWNQSSAAKAEVADVACLVPSSWDGVTQDSLRSLVYKGNQPAQALDQLLKGPAVIDCGMFCQLGVWFGIRYMLGNEVFNRIFGNTPIIITQFLYIPCEVTKPYIGNQLLDFFDSQTQAADSNNIAITHISNHTLYKYKHPGGMSNGQNCFNINDQFTIFDPNSPKAHNLSRHEIELMLHAEFNAPFTEADAEKLVLLKANSNKYHHTFNMSFAQAAAKCEDSSALVTQDFEQWQLEKAPEFTRYFNFPRFIAWLHAVSSPILGDLQYTPLADEDLNIPDSLKASIACENREQMTFNSYERRSELQQTLYAQALNFCRATMKSETIWLTLTGKAGIGKTAIAASCAKELVSRGKKVLWITEVTVRGWADQAKTMAELCESENAIRTMLQTNPDVVILDDDNIVGYAGAVLFEEIYSWYISNPNKALLITSNNPVNFEKCYGYKLDQSYKFPPFAGYMAPSFTNRIILQDLIGESHRPKPNAAMVNLPASEKIARVLQYSGAPSVGIILSRAEYQQYHHIFAAEDVEVIPDILEADMVPIRQSLNSTGAVGPKYNELTALQQKWGDIYKIRHLKVNGFTILPTVGYQIRKFASSKHQIIALEMFCQYALRSSQMLHEFDVEQFLRVLNYAHDQGGKKVILINASANLSNEEFLAYIKRSISDREKERSISRLDALLFNTEQAIVSKATNLKFTIK